MTFSPPLFAISLFLRFNYIVPFSCDLLLFFTVGRDLILSIRQLLIFSSVKSYLSAKKNERITLDGRLFLSRREKGKKKRKSNYRKSVGPMTVNHIHSVKVFGSCISLTSWLIGVNILSVNYVLYGDILNCIICFEFFKSHRSCWVS